MPRVHALCFVALVWCCACWGVVYVGTYIMSNGRGLQCYEACSVLWVDLLCLLEQQYAASTCAAEL
jgi:hypothetical protein